MSRRRSIFDIAMLAVYLAAANPVLTGIPVHEYLGLGAFVVVAAHVVASGAGLAGRGRPGRLARNVVLLMALAATVVSGVMVSGDVLPALGLYATGYHFWDPLHALAAKVLLAALLVHVVLRGPAAWAVLRAKRPGRAAAMAEASSFEEDAATE